MLDRLRTSLFGGSDAPAVYRCQDCHASFSEPQGLDPDEVTCSFCGSGDTRLQG